MQEIRVQFLGPGISPGEGMATHSSACLENSMGKEPGGLESTEVAKSQTKLND